MHIMAVHWEEIVPRLVEEAGLPTPRYQSWQDVALEKELGSGKVPTGD
jgi:hypothetical protein